MMVGVRMVNCGQMPMPQIHYEGWWLLLGVAVARRHAMFNRLFVEKNELSDPKTSLKADDIMIKKSEEEILIDSSWESFLTIDCSKRASTSGPRFNTKQQNS